MTDPISRVEGRIRQIQSLLGDPRPSNAPFESELQAAGSVPRVVGVVRRTGAGLDPLVREAAGKTGLPAELIEAVIQAESGGDRTAVSRAGAQGLMQLMPATARELGVRDPFDARENVLGGATYLRRQLDRFGSVEKALAAYNAGPGAVQRHGGVPPYPETQTYVRRVLDRMQRLDRRE